MPVIAKAMELGQLRHEQGFDEYELLKEYEIFGGILFAFLSRAVGEIDQPCTPQELVLWSRLGAFDHTEPDRLLWEQRALFEWNAYIWPIESLPIAARPQELDPPTPRRLG